MEHFWELHLRHDVLLPYILHVMDIPLDFNAFVLFFHVYFIRYGHASGLLILHSLSKEQCEDMIVGLFVFLHVPLTDRLSEASRDFHLIRYKVLGTLLLINLSTPNIRLIIFYTPLCDPDSTITYIHHLVTFIPSEFVTFPPLPHPSSPPLPPPSEY